MPGWFGESHRLVPNLCVVPIPDWTIVIDECPLSHSSPSLPPGQGRQNPHLPLITADGKSRPGVARVSHGRGIRIRIQAGTEYLVRADGGGVSRAACTVAACRKQPCGRRQPFRRVIRFEKARGHNRAMGSRDSVRCGRGVFIRASALSPSSRARGSPGGCGSDRCR